jgi:apolipoprotein N-acyltransferase
MTNERDIDTRGARMRVPRSRGAVSGLLLILLGAWGALVPLIGPYVHFGFTPDSAWHLSSGRFWLEILPGAVAALGGLLLLTAASRVTTSLGAWLGVAGGAWFVIGTQLASLLNLGGVGSPIATSKAGKAFQFLLLFDGLGALIIFVAATALGRLGVVSVRDVQAARRREDRNRSNDNDNSQDNAQDNDEPVRRQVRQPAVTTQDRVAEPSSRTVVTDPNTTTTGDAGASTPTSGGATRLNSNS